MLPAKILETQWLKKFPSEEGEGQEAKKTGKKGFDLC